MNFVDVKKCNVCGSPKLHPLVDLKSFPVILRPLGVEIINRLTELNVPKEMPLQFGICKDCAHIVQVHRLAEKVLNAIYELCYGTYLSNLVQQLGTSYADDFAEFFVPYMASFGGGEERSVLEVGCFDGYLLTKLQERGYEVCGCDPSEGVQGGLDIGLEIIKDFYSPELFPDRRFDAVINRHVIEHLEDPVSFVSALSKVTKPGGRVVIETPNGDFYLDKGLLDATHPEHLSVFTSASLTRTFHEAGLAVDHIHSEGRNLIVAGRKAEAGEIGGSVHGDAPIEALAARFNELLKQRFSKITQVLDKLNEGTRYAIWGAGAFGISLFSCFSQLQGADTVVVDQDVNKHGLGYYNLDQDIKPPQYLESHPVDCIVVASQYGDEIVRDAREKFGYDSQFVLLTPEIKIV